MNDNPISLSKEPICVDPGLSQQPDPFLQIIRQWPFRKHVIHGLNRVAERLVLGECLRRGRPLRTSAMLRKTGEFKPKE
jgi:hypothetical protein